MAIDRPLQTPDMPNPFGGGEDQIEVEIVNPESVSIDTPDGGVLLDFVSNGFRERYRRFCAQTRGWWCGFAQHLHHRTRGPRQD